MSECGSPNRDKGSHPKRFTCPENCQQYLEVLLATVLRHVDKPWRLGLKNQAYYFCDDPNCEVVYIAGDNTTFTKSMLRTKVGIKESTDDVLNR